MSDADFYRLITALEAWYAHHPAPHAAPHFIVHNLRYEVQP